MCQTPRQIKKGWDTKIPQSSGPLEKVGEEAVYKELGDRMEKAATTASSLEVEQDSGNTNRTQSMAKLNEPIDKAASTGVDDRQGGAATTVSGLEAGQGKIASTSQKNLCCSYPHTKTIQQHKKVSKGYTGVNILLFSSMLVQGPYFKLGVCLKVSTASATPEVSVAAENLMYIRRSAEKRKDKRKDIMKEDEYVQKKAKKQLEQERLRHEEAIRLTKIQLNEEERQRIARDAEIAKQLQEEFDRARQEQEVVSKVDQAHDIDWRYKQSHFKGMSYEDIGLIFERVWDQNHAFVSKDFEIKKEVMKKPGFDYLQKSIKKNDKIKASGFVQKQPAKKEKEKKNDDSQHMDVVPRDDIAIDVKSLATKYETVDWKIHVLTENMMYYQIIRVDGSSKNYKIFSEMLDDFDRQDLMDLHRLVQERYDTTSQDRSRKNVWKTPLRKVLIQEEIQDFEARKVDPIRSPTGIGAGLKELSIMESPDQIPIGDWGGFEPRDQIASRLLAGALELAEVLAVVDEGWVWLFRTTYRYLSHLLVAARVGDYAKEIGVGSGTRAILIIGFRTRGAPGVGLMTPTPQHPSNQTPDLFRSLI
ncbi:hypothetical protein Tco_0997383 [Tanacetum coccineum]